VQVQSGPLDILQSAFGADANFREGQWEAVEALVERRARLFVLQRTGWGKSIVYLLATRLLREQGLGPTLIISPLLSLMRNQIELAERCGVRAAYWSSANQDHWQTVQEQFATNQIDLLLISPERLASRSFEKTILAQYLENPGLLVVDEAHCISDWGQDFRLDYRRIGLKLIHSLPPNTPILATTATANERVIADIQEQMGDDLVTVRGPLIRESLALHVLRLPDRAQRMAWIAESLSKLPGSGIIYVLTVADADRISRWLQSKGFPVEAYHSDLPNSRKIELEAAFSENQVKALVATTALGMGYDKPDVSFVVHFQRPSSIVSYYQQIGRAGRRVPKAWVVLLEGEEDDAVNEYFIQTAVPDRDCFQAVQNVLTEYPQSLDALVSQTNWKRSQVEKALEGLEFAGIVERESNGYRLLNPSISLPTERAEALAHQRRFELEQIRGYVRTPGCRMQYLSVALGDSQGNSCGKCDNCLQRNLALPSQELTSEAEHFLRTLRSRIESKKYYPSGIKGAGRKRIPEQSLVEDGIALCTYAEGKWGKKVAEGKYVFNHFHDELLEEFAVTLEGCSLEFEWMTWVPSQRHAELLENFVLRLSKRMNLPVVRSLRKTSSEEQKTMQNSTTQCRNALAAYSAEDVFKGPCLLIDDIVDSGWTLTIAGGLLREAGCSKVVPAALASARSRERL